MNTDVRGFGLWARLKIKYPQITQITQISAVSFDYGSDRWDR
jgi:hypothetical protein